MDQGNVNAMKNSLSDIEYYMQKCSELKSTIAQKDAEIKRLRVAHNDIWTEVANPFPDKFVILRIIREALEVSDD